MKVLVTGNQGYIGSVLVPALLREGHQVSGLDVGYFQDCLFTPVDHETGGMVAHSSDDLRDVPQTSLEGVDAVIHLAALSNDPMGEFNPALTREVNHLASVRLARLAKAAGVKRFLFSSSCSMYGQADGAPVTEQHAMRPLTAYAKSKVDSEIGIKELADERFCPVFLRNGTVYGASPRLRFDLVVNNLVGWAVTTGEVRLLSDGRSWRPLVHIQDVSRAFIAALSAPADRVCGEAFNVGGETGNYQIREVAETISEVIKGCRVTFAEGASADSRTYRVNFNKLARFLPSAVPEWRLVDGVAEVYEAVRRVGIDADAFKGRRFTRLAQLKHLVSTGQVDQQLRVRARSKATRAAKLA